MYLIPGAHEKKTTGPSGFSWAPADTYTSCQVTSGVITNFDHMSKIVSECVVLISHTHYIETLFP